MGSSLAPVLANIILTEFEKTIVDDLIQTGTIAFYRRYVDDTLVLIKPKDIHKTKVIPNKVCIIRLYTIKYCIFRVNRLIFSRNFTSKILVKFLLKMSRLTRNIQYLIV